MLKKIIIVGGAGFIGSSLAQELARCGLIPIVLDTPKRLSRNINHLSGVTTGAFDFADLNRDDALFSGADALIHLACTSTPASSMQSIKSDALKNIISSISLFEAAGRHNIKKVIFASSGGTVYGNAKTFPIKENMELKPLSAYGAAKVTIETYLQLCARIFNFTGISMRLSNPYGPFQLQGSPIGLIARYLNDISAGHNLVVWGDGEIIRDFIYIDDVIEAFKKVLFAPDLECGPYNIGSGCGYSINQIIDVLQLITGLDTEVSYLPKRDFDVNTVVLNIERFTAATGWAPKIGIETGIRLMSDFNRFQIRFIK